MPQFISIFRGNEPVFARIKIADDFGGKLRGLMFYRELPGIDGLLLYPCNMVHLFWMRFPLDLVYISRDREVLFITGTISPNRFGPLVRDAYYVLETGAGTVAAKNIQTGEVLWWEMIPN